MYYKWSSCGVSHVRLIHALACPHRILWESMLKVYYPLFWIPMYIVWYTDAVHNGRLEYYELKSHWSKPHTNELNGGFSLTFMYICKMVCVYIYIYRGCVVLQLQVFFSLYASLFTGNTALLCLNHEHLYLDNHTIREDKTWPVPIKIGSFQRYQYCRPNE